MTKESATRCSSCGHNGHNSRTCNEKYGLKLFGVRILKNKRDETMKKSFSMGNLQAKVEEDGNSERGYLSDGPRHERKKGTPWTEEEHWTFLQGLEKLGKGDWRGISKEFVKTRTPTQVASHAQKYFLRQTTANKKKRRSSVFDMEIKDPVTGPKSESVPSVPSTRNNDVPEQTASSAPIATQIAPKSIQAPPTPHVPAPFGIPNFYGFPYIAGMPNPKLSYAGPKAFQTVTLLPVMNYYGNVGAFAFPPKPMNDFVPCTSNAPQSSSVNPSPLPASNCIPKVETQSSSPVNTELELGQSQVDFGSGIRVV